MAGWYVEQLLLDREAIREAIKETNDMNCLEIVDDYISYNVNSDTYCDLLSVEMELSRLIKKGLISGLDLQVLTLILGGISFSEIGNRLNLGNKRLSANGIFKNICSRIAFVLGEHFTNDGYIDYLQNKYNFNQDKVDKIKNKLFKEN
jgi:hypothetical protein